MRLYEPSTEYDVGLHYQAGRNDYPYNPKFVGNTGNRTSGLKSVYKPPALPIVIVDLNKF